MSLLIWIFVTALFLFIFDCIFPKEEAWKEMMHLTGRYLYLGHRANPIKFSGRRGFLSLVTHQATSQQPDNKSPGPSSTRVTKEF